MAMKEWIYRMRPALQLYIVLVLSVIYFIVQLSLSHITHALTLLVQCYHMLCNIVSLTGIIISVKHGQPPKSGRARRMESAAELKQLESEGAKSKETRSREGSLLNTFGWTRIEVLTTIIVCIFLASLCFSLLVEALQTLVHIDHQDAMHHPMWVLIVGGVIGLLLNGLSYILIGGYTFNQGAFLQVNSTNDVTLDQVVSGDKDTKEKERSLMRHHEIIAPKQRLFGVLRDICSTFFVIVCALIIYSIDNEEVAKYVDPALSIFSCITLLVLSYPYMKESGLILLQTIPATIDIGIFKDNLLKSFPAIHSVHDLHIWQLTARKYVSTAHLIFQNPHVYEMIIKEIEAFFHDQGITIVTIQPEFEIQVPLEKDSKSKSDCLMNCRDKTCFEKSCCNVNQQDNSLPRIKIQGHRHKPDPCSVSLRDFKALNTMETLSVENLPTRRYSSETEIRQLKQKVPSRRESDTVDFSPSPKP